MKIKKQKNIVVHSVHILCVLFAIAELSLLTVFSSLYGGAMHIVGFTIFGSALVLFYLFRTLYCFNHNCEVRGPFLKKLDHVMLYILIGATYTPVPLLLPSPYLAWSIFGVAWGIILITIVLEAFGRLSLKWITLFLYFSYWILDIVAFKAVHEFLGSEALTWFFFGGFSYMIATGLIVFRPRFKFVEYFKTHETFALIFVALGSFAHFWALLKYVLLST